jgi:uncharacterized protein YdcH (DUF465 family)
MSTDTREKLIAADPEFRRLADEHSQYAAQLEQILKSAYHNSEEFLLEAQLKKLKLRVKDQMEQRAATLAHLERPH